MTDARTAATAGSADAPVAVLRSDATALDAVAHLLAPSAPSGGPRRSYAVLPRRSRPRYLVPVAGRTARSARIRPGGSSGRSALARSLLRPALRVGAARLVPGAIRVEDGSPADPSLRLHLAQRLGRDDIDLAVALGSPRPNRKPVIQVIAGDGSTAAWAKAGVDAHTDALVAHEAAALSTHRPESPVEVPSVLAAGPWRDHQLLVLSPLEVTETGADLDIGPDAARALAGPLTEEPATTSRWWHGLEAVAADATIDPDGHLAAALEHLAPHLDRRAWPFGAWHGDLAPWNACWSGPRLVVWDWERSGGPVPAGLDLVHNRMQVALLRQGRSIDDAAAATVSTERATLRSLGYAVDDAPLVVGAYLLTLRARYLADARLGSLGPGAPIASAIDTLVAHDRLVARP